MRKNTRNILIVSIVILGLYMSTDSSVSAANEPTMTVDPEQPEQLSSVTFTVTFDNYSNIQEVDFNYNECNKDDICFLKQNVSMLSIGEGQWEITIDLEHDDAAYVQYWLEVRATEGWQEYLKITKTYLKEKVTNGGSNGQTNGDNDDTPGFEVIGLLISAIFILLILNKRKR